MSSSQNNLSAKEREILERQRKLAASLKRPPPPPPAGGAPPRPPSSSSSSTTNHSVPLQKAAEEAAAAAAAPTMRKSRPTIHHRPSSRPAVAAAKNSKPISSLVKQFSSKKPAPPAVIDLSSSPAKNKNRAAAPPSTAAVVAATAAAAVKRSSGPAQKRPTKKRTVTQTKEFLISSARAKASNAAALGISSTATEDKKPSPPIKRKKIKKVNDTGSLAKLVQHVVNDANSAANGGDDSWQSSTLPAVQPDDFWKHLRDWDFCSQYASQIQQQQQQQQQQQSSTAAEPETDSGKTTSNPATKKPLPNVFLNARHYMAAWAPLCLAECRAQLLQEAMTNRNITTPIAVTTESTSSRKRHRPGDAVVTDAWMEEETGGHILVKPKNVQDVVSGSSSTSNGDLSFTSNDLVLLIQNEYPNILSDINKGTALPPNGSDGSNNNNMEQNPHAYRSVALIGHTETSRQDWTKGGLVLKVSKRRWAAIGQPNMYLVKLGSNVTALREFTALCRVDTLPLQRYLFGRHLEREENRRKLSSRQSTEQLLQVLGGSEALGKGFIDHCRNKFNASQLTSIAASANEYGEGGFTLIKGPPGTGKTTTLVAVLNSLHIRQYNKYYEEVRRIAAKTTGSRQAALELARKAKPRLLVCAPSNAAVDNIILKIMEDGFIDGQGRRYNPSMIRVGVGQSDAVRAVSLATKVDSILADHTDIGRLETSVVGCRVELSRITTDIARLRRRLHAIQAASPYPLSKDWEIRVDEDSFDETGRVYFVNHKEKTTTYEVPPPPEPGETHFPSTSMPEYRAYLSRIVKLVENYFSIKSNLEQCTIIKSALDNGANNVEVRMSLETHVLNSVHMVMTTLGTAGNRTLEAADKFEVVVCDEAAQSVEPACLSALQLGNRHAVLVGDPQQLPATIFNVSGRNSKYDRSLFQRLEEAGQPVYMLKEQYRMHPKISHFPRHIFYGGALLDGPNVRHADYGNPLRGVLCRSVPTFQPFTVLDLDSTEERGGTSLSNISEAKLAVYLYQQLKVHTRGLSSSSRVAVITPYAQQSKLLRSLFSDALGPKYEDAVEVNTVDAFQGREANIVIFSAVRAAGSKGIGFLSDVRRMNVALTRAKHFLFVIARCQSIVVNPYWRDLVQHARESKAVVSVPNKNFGDLTSWPLEQPPVAEDPRKRKST